MLSSTPPECPPALLAQARGLAPIPTAIVNAGTPIAMQSARLAAEEGLIEPVLVGDAGDIRRIAGELNWDIDGVRVESATNEVDAAQRSVALAGNSEVGALMKGHVHTDDLLRAVLNRDSGLRTGRRLSHVFHMTVPGNEKALCITDAVVNVLPSVAEKVDIARNAIELLHSIGIADPAIALLSGSEVATPSMPSSVDADEIAKLAAAGEFEGARVSGPLSFDMAVSSEAARTKGVTDDVAGNADVLLVPNVEAGNFLFKQLVYFNSATAAGIVLGASVPIMLTSRADPAVARLAFAALAAVYACDNA